MGPRAGIDLATKIISETRATRDQDHIATVLWGNPDVPDRTEFLFGNGSLNPAREIAEGFRKLETSGATVAGMACNTAHSPLIFDEVLVRLKRGGSSLRVLHLIDETIDAIGRLYPDVKKVGILGTKGTYHFRLYDEGLTGHRLVPVRPDDIESLNDAIYDPETGIKACSSPVSPLAREKVLSSIEQVIIAGAELVIMGCTELPLAVPEPLYKGIPLIDPGTMLARALIHFVAPDRLRSWSVA